MAITETSVGPWHNVRNADQLDPWMHWASRPCLECGHAWLDHDHDPYHIGNLRCDHCACQNFRDPAYE
jgi:hypothetical protein